MSRRGGKIDVLELVGLLLVIVLIDKFSSSVAVFFYAFELTLSID